MEHGDLERAAAGEPASILLVEDEPTLARAMQLMLQKAGYRVHWAADGRQALVQFRREAADLVLLDLMLPIVDGLEVCRVIRKDSRVPIIMLTARDSERDKVAGLELGADDYLAKPFGMRELLARVRALLRRSADIATRKDRLVRVGAVSIMPLQRRVLRNGESVELRSREFDLLLFMACHAGQVFTRSQLIENVWGFDFDGESRTVDVHIRLLREKLEEDPSIPVLLQTVRNVGYRLG